MDDRLLELIGWIEEVRGESVRDYCLNFLTLSSQFLGEEQKLLSLKETREALRKDFLDEAFPENLNLYKQIHESNLALLISFVYWLPYLDIPSFQTHLNNQDHQTIYEYLLTYGENDCLLSRLGFDPTLMLSGDEDKRTLCFLFLFFLPTNKEHSPLLNIKNRGVPLCTHARISNKNFDLLLYLHQTYEPWELNLFKNSTARGLNILLIESCISQERLFFFESNNDWNKSLPIYKIKRFLDLGCSTQNIQTLITPNLKPFLGDMPEFLMQLEFDHEKEGILSAANEEKASGRGQIRKI